MEAVAALGGDSDSVEEGLEEAAGAVAEAEEAEALSAKTFSLTADRNGRKSLSGGRTRFGAGRR